MVQLHGRRNVLSQVGSVMILHKYKVINIMVIKIKNRVLAHYCTHCIFTAPYESVSIVS